MTRVFRSSGRSPGKLEARDRTRAVMVALERGILDLEDVGPRGSDEK